MRATRCSVFTPRARVVGKEIFAKWKALGLASEPNVGDNGMHASASPFEAMAERLNWVGAKLEEDAFGKAMLQAGIPRATIMEWTKDPQVAFEGKKQSLFDALEDSGYAECLAKAQAIAGVSGAIPEGKMQAPPLPLHLHPHPAAPPAPCCTPLPLLPLPRAGLRLHQTARGDWRHPDAGRAQPRGGGRQDLRRGCAWMRMIYE